MSSPSLTKPISVYISPHQILKLFGITLCFNRLVTSWWWLVFLLPSCLNSSLENNHLCVLEVVSAPVSSNVFTFISSRQICTNTVEQSFLPVIMDGYSKMILIMCLSHSVHPQEPSGGPLGPDQRFTDLRGRERTGQCLFFFFLRFVFVLQEVLTDGGETSTNRNILHSDRIIWQFHSALLQVCLCGAE